MEIPRDAIEVKHDEFSGWEFSIRDTLGNVVAHHSGYQSESACREAAGRRFDAIFEEPTEVVTYPGNGLGLTAAPTRNYRGLHWSARSHVDGWSWAVTSSVYGAIECGHRVQTVEETFAAILAAMNRYLDSKPQEPQPAA